MAADLLLCPVCLETLRDPHVLPNCGHTFCKQCIVRCAQGQSSLRCPTCRRSNRVEQALPNFAVRQLIDDGAAAGAAVAAAASGFGLGGGDIVRTVNASNSKNVGDLVNLGVPHRLAQLLCDESEQIGLRIFLLDNSGSTQHGDGVTFYTDERNGRTYSAPCTRWEEISTMAIEQAEWNAAIGIPAEFCLLNARGRDEQPHRVDASRGNVGEQIDELRRMLKRNGPTGVTPLADRVTAISERLRRQETQLFDAGQKVVLCIATDGMPTTARSGNSTHEDRDRLSRLLRQIQSQFPLHLVVRLTTDDDSIIEYYNSIDNEVELNMEVLDDIASEAREIANAGNGWLVYTPLIHKIREAGTFEKLFDLLDERPLTPSEIGTFVQLLLRNATEPPFPRQPAEFASSLASRTIPLGYCSVRGREVPIIDVRQVQRKIRPGFAANGNLTAVFAVIAVIIAFFMLVEV